MSALLVDPRIEFFDRHAPQWDSYGPPIEQTLCRLEELQPLMDFRAGEQVLEVGCGTGQVTAWLAGKVAPGRVTAVDFSARMLDHARGRGVDADFRCADVCSDDLGADCFDAVFCMHVAPHFRDHGEAIRRLARCLKRGGRLIVLHLVGRNRVNAIHADVGGPVASDHLPDLARWKELFLETSLSLTRTIDEDQLFLLVAHRQE